MKSIFVEVGSSKVSDLINKVFFQRVLKTLIDIILATLVRYIFTSLSKGPLLGLRQFLTIGSPLKMMKNGFYFMLKALFVKDSDFWLCRKTP